jgi:ligand-binding sensor domain-containing protein
MKHLLIFVVTIIAFLADSVSAQWIQTEGPYDAGITSLARSKSNLFACAQKRVCSSTDDGISWSPFYYSVPNAICVLSLNDSLLFVGTDGGGLFRFSNNGSWQKNFPGLTSRYIWGLASMGSIVYALPQGGGIFRSIDDGDTWVKSDSGIGNAIVFSLKDFGNRLYASTNVGLFISTDSGTHWIADNKNFATYLKTSLAKTSSYLFVGTNQGISRSPDGQNWERVNNGLTDTIVRALVASTDSTLFAGTDIGVFRSTNQGANWTLVTATGSIAEHITALEGNGKNVFAGTNFSFLRSTDYGDSWKVSNKGMPYAQCSELVSKDSNLYAVTGIGIFKYSQNNDWKLVLERSMSALTIYDSLLIAGFQDIYMSIDNGKSWFIDTVGTHFGDYTIYAIATNGSDLFIGTDQLGVLRSVDGGLSWSIVDSGLTSKYIRGLVVAGNNLFASAVFSSGDTTAIFRSSNNGANWEGITSPADKILYAFVSHDSTLWAGTINGVFNSNDFGSHWTKVNGLNDTIVNTIGFNQKDVFAGTSYGVFTFKNGNWTPINKGLTDSGIVSLATSSGSIFAETATAGIWHRPLSDLSIVTEKNSSNSNSMMSNYPNPFSSKTTISVSVKDRTEVSINIYDLLETQVARIYSGELSAGANSFEWDATHFSSGTYFCVLRSQDGRMTELPVVVSH